MAETYNSFDEIKDPKFRRTIEGLAKLYFNGDANAALIEFNSIKTENEKLIQESRIESALEIQLRFSHT